MMVAPADSTPPTISAVTIPNVAMNVGDVVTATITVTSDPDDYTTGSGGLVTSTIGGFALGSLSKTNDTTYTATFTVTNGGTDVAAGTDIPISVTLDDSVGNTSTAFTTAISQANDPIDANLPVISAVSIPNAAMKVGDVVTATITVTSDTDDYTTGSGGIAGTIGGFALGSLAKTNDTTYTATFTVTNGGTDVAAGTDIPISVTITDSGANPSAAFTTAISQANDPIDANAPSITNVTIPNAAMKVGDVVTATITVVSDTNDYTTGLGGIGGNIGGFALGSLSKTNDTTYTATFTVTNGGTDVAAGTDIPISVTLTDSSGSTSAAFTTAISQANDPIDANAPAISTVTIPNTGMKVGDVVTATITVTSDTDDYTTGSGGIAGNIGGFALGSLSKTNNMTYTATFTVTNGGTDVAAGTDIPISVTLTDSSGSASAAFGTAISQAGDRIDANVPAITAVTIPNVAMKVGDVVTATITVTSDTDDYTTGSGGIAGTIGGFALGSLVKTNDTTYTATFTVINGGTDVAAGTDIPISVTITDSGGNPSAAFTTAISQLNDPIDANTAVISSVTIPNAAMKVGDVVTATITVPADTDDYTTGSGGIAGTIGGFALGSLAKTNDTTYTATFTVTNGGTDVAAGTDIPINVTITDSGGNSSAAFTTAISQAGDPIDANVPAITNVTIPNAAMKVGDVVTATITVTSDTDDYTTGSGGIAGTIGGFALGSLAKTNDTTYTATFTVANGGTDVAAGTDIPISVTITDSSANPSAAFGTAISQAGDPIDANVPAITNVTIPNAAMKVGDVVTATITVTSDTDDYTTGSGGIAGTIGGFALGSLAKTNDTTYTATFTVINGGTDVAAGTDIPISVTITDSGGNPSAAFGTAISQANDPIDANTAVISSVTIPNAAMKVGDVVTATITVPADTDDYTTGSGGIAGTIGGFALGSLAKTNDTTYTATFTVTNGGTDVAAGVDIPISVTITDSGGNATAVFTTAISQGADTIDANSPAITSVTIPNVAMKAGDTVTATVTVPADTDDYTTGLGQITGNVGGFALTGFAKVNDTTYTATFLVALGGTDVPAGTDIPISVTLFDSIGNMSAAFATPISQAGDPIDANGPAITSVTIPNVAMNVGDVVTATITVVADTDDYTTGLGQIAGDIGGFVLVSLVKTNNTTYTVTFTISEGGTDVAAGTDIPINVQLTDSVGIASALFTTPISQAGDPIDANTLAITNVAIPNVAMNVGDVVTATITVNTDADDYTTGAGGIAGNIGGFTPFGSFTKVNNTTYTATFTVTEGGTDVAAGTDIPISVTITDSGGNASAAFTTAISQAADPIDANTPSITSVTIPDAGMKVGDVVTATVTVPADTDDYTTGSGAIGGNVGGFALGGFTKVNDTTYTATFTVTEGGTNVAAGTDIPISVTVTDSGGNTSAAFATAISQANDPIDANSPSITSITIPNAAMNVGDVVTATITVPSDTDDYTTGAGGLGSDIGGFTLGSLAKTSNTTYTATFTVTEGGTDVPAGTDIPLSVTIKDSAGNPSAAFATAISQAGDPIDANTLAITNVAIPNVAMNVGDVVTATITVNTDADDYTTGAGGIAGNIGGFTPFGSFTKVNNTTYTTTFTVTEGGTDVAAGTDIPISVTITDSGGNASAAFTTAISEAADPIDANTPSITSVTIPDAGMKVGDVVTATVTVPADTDDYTTGSGAIGGNVGGFALGGFTKVNDTTYTATFTVTEGGTNVAAGTDIPISVTVTDSGGNTSAAFATAISQANDPIDANTPSITSITIPNAAMNVGDVVTATITVPSDTDDYTTGAGGLGSDIGGFTLGGLAKVNDTTYTATFTVTEGGTDVPAGTDIPLSVTIKDSAGNASAAFATAISQANDPIDANTLAITNVAIPNVAMKVGDVVTATITVNTDADDYTTGAGGIAGNIGGFTPFGSFTKVNNTTYTATFTVTEGGTDVAAGTDIPISVTITDSAGNASAAFTTAISQAADPIDANTPSITSVTVPNTGMKVGDVVTATITVPSDADDYTTGSGAIAGNIGGFALGGFAKVSNTSYTATFTVTEGGTDVAAGTDIPISVTVTDSGGNTSAAFATAISQAGDPIDANTPSITSVTIPNAAMNVGDVVTATITVPSDADDYTTGSGAIGGNIGGFALGGFTKVNNTTYTATFTITEGGTDVPAGTDIPISVTVTDSGGNTSAAFATAISQAGDPIDANTLAITNVTIPNAGVKVGDVVTATITVNTDTDDYTTGAGGIAGNIGGFTRHSPVSRR